MQSITARLTLSLGSIAMLVLGAVAGSLYWTLANELEKSYRDELIGKAQMVRHFVDEARASGDIPALRHHLSDALIGHAGLRVWLVSADGTMVFGEGGVPRTTATAGDVLLLEGEGGVPMEGRREDVRDAGRLPVSSIVVAVDVRPRFELLGAYARALWLVCGAGVLASVALALAATRRGLRSVHRLSLDAAQVSATALSHRLPATGVDSELQVLVRAFNAVLDRVELAYRHMEAFNADVAHELRTPLATLINAAQVTLSGDRPAAVLRETMVEQLEDLEQIAAMVNDMLFLARADQGAQPPDTALVSLAAVVHQAVDYFEAALEAAEVRVVVQGEAKLRCNAGLIRRALSNLLSNAIKHTPAGREIVVSLRESVGCARIEVVNPGLAPSPQVRARMFDRFYRADTARGQSAESSGLGLAIVKAIAAMHKGSVHVEATAAGTVVGFTVPLSE